jgi:Ni/Co efflux regulator RcnB
MRKIILALAAVACVATAPALVSSSASAQDISVRLGGGDNRQGDRGWRDERRDYGRSEYRGHQRIFAQVRQNRCRTIIVRERHGPLLVKRTVHRC